jgi:tryptophan 2,3-dioxygenase
MAKEVYYSDYLQLDKILTAQQTESEKNGVDAHDEMLFIIVHQAYELWFKQIKYEMQSIVDILRKPSINDNSPDIFTVVHRLKRIASIWQLGIQQIDVLETMTPLDFLDFREQLRPASGFQSFQFKMLEAMMGLKFSDRHGKDFYKRHLHEEHINDIAKIEAQPSLIELLNKWLERIPFFDSSYWGSSEDIKSHPFWEQYKDAFIATLHEPDDSIINSFDQTFYEEGTLEGNRLSDKANRAALFILAYRDYPLLQVPFQLLDTLIAIDELMTTWRTRHISMVSRMIGVRTGTGGSSGADYLSKSRDHHGVFNELAGLNTYLVQRNNLPELSDSLKERLGFKQ